jgi:hypothetical protein
VNLADAVVFGCFGLMALGWVWLVVASAVAEIRDVLAAQRARAAGGDTAAAREFFDGQLDA